MNVSFLAKKEPDWHGILALFLNQSRVKSMIQKNQIHTRKVSAVEHHPNNIVHWLRQSANDLNEQTEA